MGMAQIFHDVPEETGAESNFCCNSTDSWFCILFGCLYYTECTHEGNVNPSKRHQEYGV